MSNEIKVCGTLDFTNKEKVKEVAINYLKLNKVVGLSESQLEQFILMCMEFRLNPLKNEIYAVSYGNKFNVITNYYEYLKRADATGLIEYYNIEIQEKNGVPTIGKFIGKRKDRTKELVMTFYFKEWTSGQSTWVQKPFFMFDKCILANGMRRLFPNELGNMPYVNEELWYWNKHNETIIEAHIQKEKQIDTNKLLEGDK